MNKEPKISVIVPVYKAEAYLHRCVDSIIAQTFTDWELLLVDDGSPDRSGDICDEYASKDARIRVFHKENGGVSSARQKGLDEAVGEYTIHADPDDWVEPMMLEELYKKAKEDDADMVICDFICEYKTGGITCVQKPLESTAKGILQQLLFQQLHGSCWNKLVRRTCYSKYNVKFPCHIIRWEDLYVVCSLLSHHIKCTYLPKAFYHYDLIENANSIVRKPTMHGLQSQIDFVEHFKSLGYSMDMLYPSMRATKELAYNSELLTSEEIIALFSEINDTYIKEKVGYRDFLHKGLAALLKGNKTLSTTYKLLHKMHGNIVSMMKDNTLVLKIYKGIRRK